MRRLVTRSIHTRNSLGGTTKQIQLDRHFAHLPMNSPFVVGPGLRRAMTRTRDNRAAPTSGSPTTRIREFLAVKTCFGPRLVSRDDSRFEDTP